MRNIHKWTKSKMTCAIKVKSLREVHCKILKLLYVLFCHTTCCFIFKRHPLIIHQRQCHVSPAQLPFMYPCLGQYQLADPRLLAPPSTKLRRNSPRPHHDVVITPTTTNFPHHIVIHTFQPLLPFHLYILCILVHNLPPSLDNYVHCLPSLNNFVHRLK